MTGSDDATNVLNDFMKGTAKQETSLGDYMRANSEAEMELRAAIMDLSSELTGKLFGIAEQSGKQMRLRSSEESEDLRTRIRNAVRERSVDDIHEEIYNLIGNTSIVSVAASRIRVNIQSDSFEPTIAISNFEYTGQCSFHEDGTVAIEIWKNKYRDKGTQKEYETINRRSQANGDAGKNSGYGLGIGISGDDRSGRVQNNVGSNGQTGNRATEKQNGSVFDAKRITRNSLVEENNQAQEAPDNGASSHSKEQFRLRPALQAGKERIASVTPDDAAAIVAQIKPVGLRSLLDPVRMMDRSAADQKTRQRLHELLDMIIIKEKAPYQGFFVAAELGFEPRQYESESNVSTPKLCR